MPPAVLSPLATPKLLLPVGSDNALADEALSSVLGGNDGDIPASVPGEALREALGEDLGDALGETLGDGLGDDLDDTLGGALGDALGDTFGDFVALSSLSPTSRQDWEPDSCGGCAVAWYEVTADVGTDPMLDRIVRTEKHGARRPVSAGASGSGRSPSRTLHVRSGVPPQSPGRDRAPKSLRPTDESPLRRLCGESTGICFMGVAPKPNRNKASSARSCAADASKLAALSQSLRHRIGGDSGHQAPSAACSGALGFVQTGGATSGPCCGATREGACLRPPSKRPPPPNPVKLGTLRCSPSHCEVSEVCICSRT